MLERPQACAALAAVIAFAEILADSLSHHRFGLSLYDPGRYMRLDAAAQRALNVLPARLDANNSFSLYGLLNRSRTVRRHLICEETYRTFTPIAVAIATYNQVCRHRRVNAVIPSSD